MIVGTAGHIDHGKTTLVRALTGVDTDRLPEEKARGITIDLGFAYLPLADGRTVGFVDVPGHERFIHNMLAGIGGIDFALLVVAADDGVMPQTREHLAILDLLGVSRGTVVITKADLANAERLEALEDEIRTLLADTSLAEAEIAAVSAQSGLGLDDLRARLELEAEVTRERATAGRFRLPIDRCFTLSGAGTVVTGTVFAGEVREGDQLVIASSGAAARVRSLHAQNRAAEIGVAGQRCAINIAGPQIAKDSIHRGDWLLAAALRKPTDRIDARIRLLADEPRPLRSWTPVHLHLGAAHAMARVVPLDVEAIEPGQRALVQLVLEAPIGALHGDRLILRDQSARRTMAGGMVLDPWGPARYRRKPERLAALNAQADTDPVTALKALTGLPPQVVDLGLFGVARNLKREALDDVVAHAGAVSLPAPGVEGGPFGFSAPRFAELEAESVAALKAHHEKNPNSAGMEPSKLRLALPTRVAPAPFSAVTTALLKSKKVEADGPWLRLPGHSVRLSPLDERLWAKIQPVLKSARFGPPRVRDFADEFDFTEAQVRDLMRRLSRMAVVWQVAPDHFFLRDAVAEMARIVEDLATSAADGTFKAAEFRDKIGGGRKVAIQILEFFDRAGLTSLKNERRTIDKVKLERFVSRVGPA